VSLVVGLVEGSLSARPRVSLVVGLVEGSLSARPRVSDGCCRCCGSSFPSSSGRHLTKLQAKAFPTMVSVSTTIASSGVVALLGGVLLGCFLLGLCLPGENLSPVLRRSNDGRRFGSHVIASLVVVWLDGHWKT
jgi:hypothetical protein